MNASFPEEVIRNDQSKNLKLSILLKRDGFSFAIFDALTGRVKYLTTEAEGMEAGVSGKGALLNQLIQRHSWITNDFVSRCLLVETPRSTLVPAALFESAHAAKFLQFNFGDTAGADVCFDRIHENTAFLVYDLPREIGVFNNENKLFSHVFSHFTVLLEKQLLQNRSFEGVFSAFLNIRGMDADLLIFRGKKLVLQNSFACNRETDVLYYVMYSMEQAGAHQKDILLEYSGDEGAVPDLLRKYIRKVQPAGSEGDIPPGVSAEDYRHYYTLINSQLCVSLAEISGAGI